MSKKMKGNSLGISLILVVFILLCLITFGTLSFMLSNADNEMSISTAENIIEFYDADILAQERLQSIDSLLVNLYEASNDAETYFIAVEEAFYDDTDVEIQVEDGSCYLIFSTKVSDVEILISEIEVCYPVTDRYYRIESWVLENSTSL